MTTSLSDTFEYREACLRAAGEEFGHFKRLGPIRRLMEHVDPAHGWRYLETLPAPLPPKLLAAMRENDKQGGASLFNYNGMMIAPTTMRHGAMAYRLSKLFKPLGNVIEIGGGYGGLCLVMSKWAKFKSWTLVDLGPTLALNRRYLEGVPNVAYLDAEGDSWGEGYDLVVSTYAYSECSPEMKEAYLEKILKVTPRGYLVCNNGGGPELADMLDAELLPEDPLTNEGNYVVRWGHGRTHS